MSDLDQDETLKPDPSSGSRRSFSDTDDLDFGVTVRGFVDGQHVFDRYVLLRILGRGGMGVVWQAHDTKLERDVALKFMPEMVRLDASAIDELKRETRKSLELTHKNIVRIHDFVEDGQSAAISMEFVDGATLSALRVQKPNRIFEVEDIIDWVRQVCEALNYAHSEAKIVHRDLKPANLMLTRSGMLKIADFGIARSISDSVSRISMAQASTSGSPPYMSPQQVMGKPSQIADDIYSLGATLYDLLTGKPPFYTGNLYRQIEDIVPPSIAERRQELGVEDAEDIPAAWEEVIARCLSKDPADRPGSSREVWEALQGGMPLAPAKRRTGRSSDTGRKSRLVPVLVILLLLVAGGGAAWWFGIEQPRQSAAAEAVAQAERSVRVAELLAEAGRHAAARHWTDARLAYLEVLRLDPSNATAREQAAEIDNLMARPRGTVRVDAASPEGTTVRVGDDDPQPVPGALTDIPVGTHTLTFEYPGYEPVIRTAQITEAGQLLQLEPVALTPKPVPVRLTADPPGLAWSIRPLDGRGERRSGSGAVTLDLAPGNYEVTWSLPGLGEDRRELTIPLGTESVPLDLALPYAAVAIDSDTPGAAVFDNSGTRLGPVPFRQSPVRPGRYYYTIKAPGYRDEKITYEAAEKAPAPRQVALAAAPTPTPRPQATPPATPSSTPRPAATPRPTPAPGGGFFKDTGW